MTFSGHNDGYLAFSLGVYGLGGENIIYNVWLVAIRLSFFGTSCEK